MPNPIQLLRQRQANNRATFAQKQQNYQAAQEHNLVGRILGRNAETGLTEVQLDNGSIVPCRTVTNGNLKANSAAIVTLNGNTAWVDGMPS